MKVDIYNTDKKYNIIYADPPWHYRTWRDGNGTANRHYQTMKIEEIVQKEKDFTFHEIDAVKLDRA